MQTQTAYTPRNTAPLFVKSATPRISDTVELVSLLHHFAFGFADEFGDERAMVHITSLLDRMVPLISLRAPDGIDEAMHCRQIRGLQEILLCARGRHIDEVKVDYIRRHLTDRIYSLSGNEVFPVS